MLLALAGAEDEAQRLRLSRFALMPLQPAQVQLHLPLVRRLEVAELQVDRHQPLQLPVIEEQVEVVIPGVDLHPLLACDEAEAAAQLEDERLDLPQDRRLDVLFPEGVLESQEIEEVGIAEDEVGRQLVLLAQLLELQGREIRRFP